MAVPLEIAIAPDRTLAVLRLPPGASATLDALQERLEAEGVCYGLQPEQLLAATQESEEERVLLMAEGEPPSSGLTATLAEGLTGEGDPVTAGQQVGLIRRIADPAAGMGVDGGILPPPEHPDDMQPGEGILCRGETGIFAVVAGDLTLDADAVWSVRNAVEGSTAPQAGQVETTVEPVKVEIDPLGMEASVVIPADQAHTAAALKAGLAAAGVVHGLDTEALTAALQPVPEPRRLVVARGTPSENGVDGWIEYHIDDKPVFEVRADGSYDFSESNLIHEVEEGQVLCTCHPPTAGRSGMTVVGKPLPAQAGREADVDRHRGEGADQRGGDIVAARQGIYNRRANGSVEVKQLLLIDGDLDMHTGNVETEYSIHIRGDVKAGFKVKSAGNVVIDGSIEDSRVSAQGNLEVKGGILPGADRVKAHGNLICRYIRERTIKANDVMVKSIVRHSWIYATGSVVAEEVLGGRMIAAGDITIRVLGDGDEQYSWAQAGVDPYQQACFEEASQGHAALQSQVEKLRERVLSSTQRAEDLAKKVTRMKAMRGKPAKLKKAAEEARAALEFSQEVAAEYQVKAAELRETERLLDEHEQTSDAQLPRQIRVTGVVHPGCEVAIGPVHQRRIAAVEHNVCFRIVKDQLTT